MAGSFDQTSLVEFARSEDPAMVSTVKEPSAITQSGECEVRQRKEARSHQRNDVPVKRGKARDALKDSGLSEADDNSRGKGGTQKFLAVHSQFRGIGFSRL